MSASIQMLYVAKRRRELAKERRARFLYIAMVAVSTAGLFITATN